MKDVSLYVFFSALYATLALRYFVGDALRNANALSWHALAHYALLFTGVLTLARFTVMAFKKRERLPKGQKIMGVEEEIPPQVLDVLRPVVITHEDKKPRLRKLKKK